MLGMRKMDWWVVNGVVWILVGLVLFGFRVAVGVSLGAAVFIDGLSVLVGAALLKRSKVAFWLTLVVAVVNFVGKLPKLANIAKQTGEPIIDLSFIVSAVLLALVLMLWQEIRKDKKNK